MTVDAGAPVPSPADGSSGPSGRKVGPPEVYADASARLLALGRGLDDADGWLPTPACAGWTVHDVFAHLSGLVADVLAGRLEGLATPPWTARQVEARRHLPLGAVLDEWESALPGFVEFYATTWPDRAPAALDVVTHEQDIRGGLGRPGARDSVGVAYLAERAAAFASGRLAEAGVGPVRLGRHGPAGGSASLAVDVSDFELGRGVMGRRSLAQLRAWPWEGDPAPALGHLTLFTPSILDVVD
jgi:uncharacterized protein (TIGR03083 family)